MADKNEVELLLKLKDEMSKGFKKIDDTQSKTFGSLQKNTQAAKSSFGGLGKSLPIVPMLGFAGGVLAVSKSLSFAISANKEFEQSMANLRAISNPTEDGFRTLSETARELGKTTVFSAKESAEAFTELAKLGFKTNEIIAASSAVLSLAAGTGEDMASSAETMAATLSQFNLEASSSGKVADIMAKSFTESALNLERFREAMKFAGPAAAASNVELETTTALLEILSNNAINGTVAGNGLKRVFIDMQTSSSKLSRFLKTLGVEASATVEEKFKALNKAGLSFGEVAELVGKISATSTSILIKNADSIDKVRSSLENAEGAAKKMAEIRLDTLEGDLKLLSSAASEAGIQLGGMFSSAARGSVQSTSLAFKLLADTMQYGLIDAYRKSALEQDKLDLAVAKTNYEINEMIGMQTLVQAGAINVADSVAIQRKEWELLSRQVDITGKDISTALTEVDAQTGSKMRGVRIRPSLLPSDAKKAKDDIEKEFGDLFLNAEIDIAMAQDNTFKDNVDELHQWEKEQDAKAKEELLRAHEQFMEQINQINQQYADEKFAKENGRIALLEEQKARELEIHKNNAEEIAAIELLYANKVADEKEKIAEQEAKQKKMVADANLNMVNSLIDAAEVGLKASKASASAQKAVAIGQIQMNAAVGMMKVWADPGYPAAIPLTIAIGAQSTAASATVANQSFAGGGIVQPEYGKAPQGDQIMVGTNPGEEIITQDDPRHSDNQGAINSQPISITLELEGDVMAQVVADAQSRNELTGRGLGRGF